MEKVIVFTGKYKELNELHRNCNFEHFVYGTYFAKERTHCAACVTVTSHKDYFDLMASIVKDTTIKAVLEFPNADRELKFPPVDCLYTPIGKESVNTKVNWIFPEYLKEDYKGYIEVGMPDFSIKLAKPGGEPTGYFEFIPDIMYSCGKVML